MKNWFLSVKEDFIHNFIDGNRWKWIAEGFKNTLLISFFAVILGIILGVIVATIRSTYDKNSESMKRKGGFSYYAMKTLNGICNLYLTIIRGTPMVVQLLIMYFVILASVKEGLYVAILAFGINSGAYLAEIFRSGIMSVDGGQFEAGRALGFNYVQTMIYIIIPQMFKIVLPTLLNEFIALIKETAVAGYVGIRDLTKAGDEIRGRTFSAFMPLVGVALIYLCVVIVLTKLVGILEKKLRKNER